MQASCIVAWRDAIQADTSANYHFEMGIALLAQDPPAAVPHFRQAVNLLPRRPDHHLLLVQALTASGNVEEARAADQAASAAHPDYRTLGLIHMALRSLQTLEKGDASQLLDEAERGGSTLETRLARFALRCLAEADPGIPETVSADLDAGLVWPLCEALSAIASARLTAGTFTAAAAAAGLAVTLTPDSPSLDALQSLARAQARLGLGDKAVQTYDRAIESNRFDPLLRIEKAKLIENQVGEIGTISGLLAEALRLAPESVIARQDYGHFLLWRGAFERLDSLLEGWETGKPSGDLNQRLLCLRQLAAGQLDAAVETGRKELARWPDNPLFPIYTAFALQGLGQHDEALQIIGHLSPESSAWAATSHGQILLGAGRIDEALRRLEDALTAAPSDPWVVTGAALGRLSKGDREGFVATLREATRLQPLRLWFHSRLRPFFTAALEAGYRETGFTETGWWPIPAQRVAP